MKIVFLSNYYNHHQSAFSEAMFAKTNSQYLFVETSEVSQWRLDLGYGIASVPDYVKKYGKDATSDVNLRKQIDEADVVIIGSAPQYLIENRIRNKKLTFEYSERINKTGLNFYKWCRQFSSRIIHESRYRRTYMLCASAYTAMDYAKLFAYKGKTYKWGYYPKLVQYDDIDRLIELKHPASILWVARFIDWKHPEIPILIAKRLKEEGYHFTLSLIGNGDLEKKMEQMIAENSLSDCVNLLGSMKPEQVRIHMERSEIFLFTSDFNEGWGAVLNESMNSACAVVASHAIGSVPFLLMDGENGLIYENGNTDSCYQKVKYLLDNPSVRKEYGKQAYFTLRDTWNADVAAERLVHLSEHLLAGEKNLDLYQSGPCSKAGIIRNNWIKIVQRKV